MEWQNNSNVKATPTLFTIWISIAVNTYVEEFKTINIYYIKTIGISYWTKEMQKKESKKQYGWSMVS